MVPREVSVLVKDDSSVNTSASVTQSRSDPANRPSASVSSSNRASKNPPALRKTSRTSESTLNTVGSISRSASLSAAPLTPRYPRRTQEQISSTTVPPPPPSVPYFFDWNPRSVVDEENIKGSVSSRGPRFYDMHLHEDLLLKRIVLVPDLASQIARIADLSLAKHGNILPRGRKAIKSLFPTEASLVDVEILHTKSEWEVQSFYQDQIAPACLMMASMLGFATNKVVFRWDARRSEQTKAMADGFLSVKARVPGLQKELQEMIDLLIYWKLDILALWEFKSLAVGCRAVMMAIRQLATEKSFLWTACMPNHRCSSRMAHPRDALAPIKTGRKTGPDTQSPPWTFTWSVGKEKRSFDDMCDLDDEDDYLSEEEDADMYSDGDPSDDESPTTAAAKKSRREPRKQTDVMKGHDALQQGWAEAVQCDATFIVINAGQYELIGVRHRESQTLYLSDVIKICESNPAYGKLHTGLYIAAFDDAVNRAGQLRDIQRSPGGIFNRCYRRKYRHDKVKYNHANHHDVASQHEEEVVAQAEGQKLLSMASMTLRQDLEIQLHSNLQILGDQIQKFRRLNSEGIPFCGPEQPHSLILMLELLNGLVYDCMVLVGDKSFGNKFVVKLAVRDSDRINLRNEYVRYIWLKEQGFTGVVEVFGLFGCEVEGRQKWGLVLSYGGVSLLQPAAARTKAKQERRRPQVEKMLKDLKLHGIIHHGLLLDHLIVDSKGRLSLVSWAFADVLPPVANFWDVASMDEGDDSNLAGLTEKEKADRANAMSERRSKWRDWELENELATRSVRRAFGLE